MESPGKSPVEGHHRDHLKEALRSALREERRRLPLTLDSTVGASRLASLCPREEVLAAREDVVRPYVEEPASTLTFAQGHGIHWALQNKILPRAGVLLGRWLCEDCGCFYGGEGLVGAPGTPIVVQPDAPPDLSSLIPRPKACGRCGSRDLFYRELFLSFPALRVGGRPDGFLRIEGLPGLGIVDCKSTSKPWEVRGAPLYSHAVQVQVYLFFTGLRWGKVLYWHKEASGVEALIEHTIWRDDALIAEIRRTMEEMWAGIGGGPIPARICRVEEAPRAKSCALCGPCFRPELPPEPDPEEAERERIAQESDAGGVF